jgi:hypothetical protein
MEKNECPISTESDFMNISIKLQEYDRLMKDLFIAYEYDPKKNSKKIYSKIVSLLMQRNFPERYIVNKITHDIPKYARLVHNEQKYRIISECDKLVRKIQKNIRGNIYEDLSKIKIDIESISNQCIAFSIKNKLISNDELKRYNTIVNHFKKINQDVPKYISFQFFPMAGVIENMIKSQL